MVGWASSLNHMECTSEYMKDHVLELRRKRWRHDWEGPEKGERSTNRTHLPAQIFQVLNPMAISWCSNPIPTNRILKKHPSVIHTSSFTLPIRKITSSKYDPTKTQKFMRIWKDVPWRRLGPFRLYENVQVGKLSGLVRLQVPPPASHSCHSFLRECRHSTWNNFYSSELGRTDHVHCCSARAGSVYLFFRVTVCVTGTKAVYLFFRRLWLKTGILIWINQLITFAWNSLGLTVIEF